MSQFYSYLRWQQILLLGLLLLSSWQSPHIQAANNLTVSVSASNFRFTPEATTMIVGTTVIWTNAGGLHNVVADDSSFSSGQPMNQFTFQKQFTTPGTYAYHCAVHGATNGIGMSGRIVVVAPFAYLPLVVRE